MPKVAIGHNPGHKSLYLKSMLKEDNKEPIPEHLRELIDYAIEYIENSTTDWFKIKSQLVNLFPPAERSRFSRRHYSTKKHILNLFDRSVINYWETKTGIKLEIDPEKLHPETWTKKRKRWGLARIHEEKRRSKTATTPESG